MKKISFILIGLLITSSSLLTQNTVTILTQDSTFEKNNLLLKKNGSGEDKKEVLLYHMNSAFNSNEQIWGSSSVYFYLEHPSWATSSYGLNNIENAIRAAFTIWNSESDELKFYYRGTTNKGFATDDQNTIVWMDPNLPGALPGLGSNIGGAIPMIKGIPPFTGPGSLKECDMVFNKNSPLNFDINVFPSRNSGVYDFITVMLHELGHAKGLGHVPDISYIMHEAYHYCTAPLRQLTYGEKVGALYNYFPNNLIVGSNTTHLVAALTGGKTINLSSNIILSSGHWFELENSKVTVNLNGYYIKNNAGTFIDAGGNTWNPNIYIMQGSNLLAHYSTLTQALTYVSSGQTIFIGGTYTENLAITIPAGVTLLLQSGTTVNFNGSLTINGSLTTNGATLNFASGIGLVVNGTANCQNTLFTGSYNWAGIVLNSSATFN